MDDRDHDDHHHQEKPSSNSRLEATNKLKIKLRILNQEDQQDHEVGELEQEEASQDNYNRSNNLQDCNQVDKEDEEEEEGIKGSSSAAAGDDNDHGLMLIRAASSGVCCPICKKGFATGKALGGHMRVHSDSGSGHHQPKSGYNPDPGPNTNGFRCSICGKEFPSQKSLFGHMRSHPDRLWRGMQPPSDADSDPDDESGRAVELPRWGEKGKRGQNNHRAEPAAGDLMMLQQVAESDAGKGRGERKSSPSEQFGDVKKRACNFDPDELYFLQNLGFFLGQNDDVVHEEEGDHDQASPKKEGVMVDPTRIHQTRNPRLKEKKINGNEKRVRDLGEKEEGERWRCNTCNKTFPTHQALGGHMSSHNKEKNHNYSHNSNNIPTKTKCIHIHTYTCVGSVKAASGHNIDGGGDVENEKVVNKFKGKKANKSFLSSKKCRFPSPSGQSSHQIGQKGNILELDLNVAPPTYEEDGVVDSSGHSIS